MAHSRTPSPKVTLSVGKVVGAQAVSSVIPEASFVHTAVRIVLHTVALRMVENPFALVHGAVAKFHRAYSMACASLEVSSILVALFALCAPVRCNPLPVRLPLAINAP